jgi:CMP-N-acetylneuraminic acid synthetase
MFREKKVLGVIPARGNSKRLPSKNIRYIGNRPLIAWSINAARGSEILDKIVVSTENSDIARVAAECGIHEVIQRSQSLAEDCAATTDVLLEVLDVLKNQGECYDYIVLLQPTSPLRTAVHIKEAFRLMNEKNALGAVSVCRTEHPVEWMGKVSEDRFLDSFIRDTKLEKRSQEFLPSFQINGAIYITPVNQFLSEGTLFLRSGMVAYVMDRASSVDIDDDFDFELADWLLTRREGS